MHRRFFSTAVAMAPLLVCAPALAQQIDPNIQQRIEREFERQGLSKRIIEKPDGYKSERKVPEKKEPRQKKRLPTDEKDDD